MRFIDQHDGNVIADRINAFALNAFEAILVLEQFNGSLAQRTNEDFEQILGYGHRNSF
jgi:hypothetical protein